MAAKSATQIAVIEAMNRRDLELPREELKWRGAEFARRRERQLIAFVPVLRVESSP